MCGRYSTLSRLIDRTSPPGIRTNRPNRMQIGASAPKNALGNPRPTQKMGIDRGPHLRQRNQVRAPQAAAQPAGGHNLLLRCLRILAIARHRKHQRPHPKMAASSHRSRPHDRRRHPGHRHDHQPHPKKIPRLQDTRRGLPQRAWRRCPDLLPSACGASFLNPPTANSGKIGSATTKKPSLRNSITFAAPSH